MTVVKKFGLALHITFHGTDKAINTFTEIHAEISRRGYGIDLPEVGKTNMLTVPGVGRVEITRTDEYTCTVKHLQGALLSRIAHVFASE